MNELIAKIGKYILKKNELKAKRQRARAKVGYYTTLFKLHGTYQIHTSHLRGWKKWNKPGKKQELRLLRKKYLIQQLQAEIEAHELVISMRKELNKIRKEMPFDMPMGTDMIWGIRLKKFGSDFNKIIKLNEIERIVVNQDAENILLKGVI